jgi:hypothetical protein
MANVQAGLAGLIEAVVAGKPANAPASRADVDEMNADHADTHADVGKAEVLDALSAGGDAFLTQLRSLSDEDLDRGVGQFVGNETTIGQVVQFAVIAHQREHLASIRAALAQ